MFSSLETWLLSAIHTMPLELFVGIASFIEEVIAPVPSASVLLATGAFAAMQERPLIGLIPLALVAAFGKMVGAMVVYEVANTFGMLVVNKFGRFFEITPERLAAFGARINNAKSAFWFLAVVRALPIVPSSIVSVSCGVLKVRRKLYIASTFVGTIVRDSVFIYIGYQGIQLWQTFAERLTYFESSLQWLLIGLLLIILVWLYVRHVKRGTGNE
jgi:membrane protein DedA with SNARE-associated domain